MRWALAAAGLAGAVQALPAQAPAPFQPSGAAAPIELPPMFVEGVGRGGPQWRHAEGPGFEVLSCCDDAVTVGFMSRTLEQQALLGELVPRALQRQTLAPTVVILLSDSFAGTMSAEMAAEMRRNAARTAGSGQARGEIHGLPQLRLSESDSDMSYFILSDHGARRVARAGPGGGEEVSPESLEQDYEGLRLAPEFVTHLMVGRTPPLPLWYIAGMTRLFRSSELSDREIELAPAEWGSTGEADRLRADAHAPRWLLSMAEVFVGDRPLPPDPAENPAYRQLWFDQSALFVRWALDGADPARRAALARWAAAEGPDRQSEAYFRTCFGLGWSDVRDRLSDYLPVAVRRPLSWRPSARPVVPPIDLRAATSAEIRRIKGEWERREVAFVRDRHPEFLSHYIERARTTLTRAWEAGDRDPRLLASLGLLDAEIGDTAGARNFLGAAVEAHVVRPRVEAELARVRLADPWERVGPAGGPDRRAMGGSGAAPQAKPFLRPGDAAGIIAPLLLARAELPPQLETYFLLSEVVRLSPGDPPPELRAALREGVRFFPDTRGLALAAAVWEARAGDRNAALRMLDLGLASEPVGAADRERLLALRRRLGGGAASAGAPRAADDPWNPSWMAAGARAGPGADPRDRRDLSLSPDGRHLAYLAPFGGRTERLVILDLDRPTAPVILSLPHVPRAEVAPRAQARQRAGSSGSGLSGLSGLSGGSARSAGGGGLAGLTRANGGAGGAAASNSSAATPETDAGTAAGAVPPAAPRLSWTATGRIVVGLGARAVFAVEETGAGLRWLHPKDPDFASVSASGESTAAVATVGPTVWDRRTQRPVGRRAPSASSRTSWSDPQLAAAQAGLEAKLPDRRVALLDWDQARARFLAVAQTPDGRGRCFVFQPETHLLLEVPLDGP
jgi:hypothetical protein